MKKILIEIEYEKVEDLELLKIFKHKIIAYPRKNIFDNYE